MSRSQAIALDQFDIDAAVEVYAGREGIEIGEPLEQRLPHRAFCPRNAGGHLFLTCCGFTSCVHCEKIAWA